MKLIAIEKHFVTPEIATAWDGSAMGQESTGSLDQGEIGQRLKDPGEGRFSLMDKNGLGVQVLSVTTPGQHNLEAEESVRLARKTNDLVAATIIKHPTCFQGFAVLPMPSPGSAALELERAVTRLEK